MQRTHTPNKQRILESHRCLMLVFENVLFRSTSARRAMSQIPSGQPFPGVHLAMPRSAQNRDVVGVLYPHRGSSRHWDGAGAAEEPKSINQGPSVPECHCRTCLRGQPSWCWPSAEIRVGNLCVLPKSAGAMAERWCKSNARP